MPKKRKSGGRTKGKKGGAETVQCTKCGRSVPRDKAKKRTRRSSVVDPKIYKELKKQGAIIPRRTSIDYYCVKCAVHYRVVKIRSKDSRKGG